MSEEIKVTSIKKIHHSGKVYDINVEDEHNYAVSDVIVHNSAAGSEVCYLTGITKVDPLTNNLLFERFLNPARAKSSLPDVDVDIQATTARHGYSGKDVLIESLSRDKFPFSGQIVNEMRATTIILFKQLAKVFGISFQDANKVSTDSEIADVLFYEDEYTGWLEDQLSKLNIQYDYRWKELDKYMWFCYQYGGHNHGDNATGVLWNNSIHASGVLFYPVNDKNVLPKSKQGVIYRGHDLEYMGYIKYDLLGLASLDPIKAFIPRIEKDTGRPFDWEDCYDPETWEVFKRADTDFVFQFSSPGMKRALSIVKPDNIDALAELNAIYRPGCINAGIFENYLKNDFPEEQTIVGSFLKEEFGEQHSLAMIFQEDIMKIVEKMAGFSLAEADLIRRAIQRKQDDVMQSYKKQFIEGFKVEKYGDIAEQVWSSIEAFATYAFNRSHSVAYSCIAYWTAYIFCHYKNEYLMQMLNTDKDRQKIIKYLSRDHKIVFPSLSTTNTEYVVTDDSLYIPTAAVSNQDIVEYLLTLDAEKKRMIVKFGVLDNFCVDRKGLRELFSTIPAKKIKDLPAVQRECLKSNTIRELLDKLSAIDWLDYEEERGLFNITVKRAKSIKNVVLKTKPDKVILKHNCQEDIRGFGIVRSKYVDEAPEIPLQDIVESFQRNDFAPDADKRFTLNKIVGMNPYVREINNEYKTYRAVYKESRLTGYPRVTLVFSNDVVDVGLPNKNWTLINKIKSFDKNTPVEVSFSLDYYISRDGEPKASLKIRNIEERTA